MMLELIKVVNLKYKSHSLRYVILLFIILAFLIFSVKVFDSCKTVGVYDEEEGILRFSIPYDKVKLIDDNVKILYDNEFLTFEDLHFLEVHIDNGIVMQDFSAEIESKETKVMDLKIMNNKQRLVKKIYSLMKEG